MDAGWTFLPDKNHAFAYRVPVEPGTQPNGRIHARQFLVVEVVVGNSYAYLIEPEHRAPSDSFSLGVFAAKLLEGVLRPNQKLDSSHFQSIAISFEETRREGGSWTRAETLLKQFKILSPRHPPKEPTRGQAEGYARRICESLFAMIGDARAYARWNSSKASDK